MLFSRFYFDEENGILEERGSTWKGLALQQNKWYFDEENNSKEVVHLRMDMG